MLKPLLAAAALLVCFAAGAAAQTPPPVDAMTCDQLVAEMTGAGQTMTNQLDPEFAREAQAMHDEAQGRTPQDGSPDEQVAGNHARMGAQMDRLHASMAGLDQARLMAMGQRFEQLGCQTPN